MKAPKSSSGRSSRIRSAGRPARARAQCPGHRVLDRRQRCDARRLPPELPAGIRRRPHRRLRGRAGQAVVRRAGAGQRLWHGGGGRIQAVGGAPRGRVVALERYPPDRGQMQGPVRDRRAAAAKADAIFIPDGADAVPTVVQALVCHGLDIKTVQLLGTGLVGGRTDLRQSGTATAAGMRGPIWPASAVSRPLSHQIRPGSGAHRFAGL